MSPQETQLVHQYLYYVLSKPVWTDAQYDDFCRENRLQCGGGSDCDGHYADDVKQAAKAILEE